MTNPVHSPANTSSKSIICQIRNLERPKPQEKLQKFNGQGEYKGNLKSSPHNIQECCFFQYFLSCGPEQQDRERNEQHQILNTLSCEISGTILSIFPDPPVRHHIRKGIHPHIPVQQRAKQDHGCIKGQKKQHFL